VLPLLKKTNFGGLPGAILLFKSEPKRRPNLLFGCRCASKIKKNLQKSFVGLNAVG
jgi:hypothetical protein